MHLDRLITLLELIAVAGRPISPAELLKATGLPKPTCYRLIQTLQDHRLVESPDNTGKVEIGERLIRLALLGKADVDVRKAAAPLLKAAAIEYNETVFWHGFAIARLKSFMLKRQQIQRGLSFIPDLASARCMPVLAQKQ